ncbi:MULTISPECIES: oxidoreductase [Arthrobacter]|uniref:Oxidoreductase n=2 Tax=Arthrobacter TaxID=1663 RepID=A0ABU9KJH4_9MICC|nr:oxidoreductase [Arthrobacter sp. YJM1]MDP5226773.1 oxidoreductase [Arthrobacter sp. YJM1]
MEKKIALVTGASSGIGEATAHSLRKAGFTVYAAARRVDRMTALADDGVKTVSLDVTDDGSARAVVEQIIAVEGRLDVLVNNAGYGSYGALEEVPLSEAQAQLDVNVLGLARMTQLVLPQMRAQRSGRIINISSMGGRFAAPLGAWYHASKFAVEALSDALRIEVAPFGIDVVVIEPGSIRTEWGAIAAGNLQAVSSDGPYSALAAAVGTTLANTSRPGARMTSGPGVVARAVAKAATTRRPRTRYLIGFGAKPVAVLRRLLPDRAFDAVITRAFGVGV